MYLKTLTEEQAHYNCRMTTAEIKAMLALKEFQRNVLLRSEGDNVHLGITNGCRIFDSVILTFSKTVLKV